MEERKRRRDRSFGVRNPIKDEKQREILIRRCFIIDIFMYITEWHTREEREKFNCRTPRRKSVYVIPLQDER